MMKVNSSTAPTSRNAIVLVSPQPYCFWPARLMP